jgi:hypothetical protein
MDAMMRMLGLSLAIVAAVAAAPAAFAADIGPAEPAAFSGDIVKQRKDVDEVSRPLPPSGPATPVPYCSPGAPICP